MTSWWQHVEDGRSHHDGRIILWQEGLTNGHGDPRSRINNENLIIHTNKVSNQTFLTERAIKYLIQGCFQCHPTPRIALFVYLFVPFFTYLNTHHSIVWCVTHTVWLWVYQMSWGSTGWHGVWHGGWQRRWHGGHQRQCGSHHVTHTAWAKNKSGRAKSRPKFGDPWSDLTGGPGFGGVQGPVSGPDRPLEF